jgi:NADH:ubiquinone oxidoreductase subunit H
VLGLLVLALFLIGLIAALVWFERKVAAQRGPKRSGQERRSARDAVMNVFRVPR